MAEIGVWEQGVDPGTELEQSKAWRGGKGDNRGDSDDGVNGEPEGEGNRGPSGQYIRRWRRGEVPCGKEGHRGKRS